LAGDQSVARRTGARACDIRWPWPAHPPRCALFRALVRHQTRCRQSARAADGGGARMIMIGLTGSIGMGKSTVAKMCEEEGAPAFNSDDAVHTLYAKGGAAVGPVGDAFPSAVRNSAVDREALSVLVVNNPEAIKRLESIVHPLVGQANAAFLEKH